LAIVDTLAALPQRLVVLVDEQVQVIVLGLAGLGRQRRFTVGSEFSLVADGAAQVLASQRVQEHLFQRREGIVTDLDLVAPQAAVADAEEAFLELHIAVLAVHRPLDPLEEELQRALQVHLTRELLAVLITLLGCLADFRMRPLVIAHLQPGREGSVESVQGQDVSRADLGLELDLHRLEEAFDQPARRRIAGWPVQQFDVQRITGGLQGVGIVDLGVVQVQFAAGSVGRPGPQQRIHQDVQRLPEVVPRRDDVAAVTVDESREMRADRLAFIEHVGAFLEIAQPQGVGLFAGPAAANPGRGDSQFQPRGPGLL